MDGSRSYQRKQHYKTHVFMYILKKKQKQNTTRNLVPFVRLLAGKSQAMLERDRRGTGHSSSEERSASPPCPRSNAGWSDAGGLWDSGPLLFLQFLAQPSPLCCLATRTSTDPSSIPAGAAALPSWRWEHDRSPASIDSDRKSVPSPDHRRPSLRLRITQLSPRAHPALLRHPHGL